MGCIQEFSAKISAEEWVLLSEGFDGSWSYLIWGRPPVQGYLGRTREIDAKKKALDAARAYLVASGRARESLALSKLPWRIATRIIENDVPPGHDEMQLRMNRFGLQQSGTHSTAGGYPNASASA
jgi:hypothetical protein